MRFVLFYHSFVSCWNHGSAHFLRGVARELIRGGHDVVIYEPKNGWSRMNALSDGGAAAIAEAATLVPGVEIRPYRLETLDLDEALDDADVVLVHEWNEPELIAMLGAKRSHGGNFQLLFHDTHHRAVTAPLEMEQLDLDGYDGVLAFGDVLREVYLEQGWGRQVFTWHEAADSRVFKMNPSAPKETDLVWIGNWGAGGRSLELQHYLIEPVAKLGLKARIYGVRYPDVARERLKENGIAYAGWLPNHRAPEAFARARFTVHVPRRPYVEALPGIPTIRVFEALSCGIPLISAPWDDVEGLFPAGSYLPVKDGDEMRDAMSLLMKDEDFAEDMVRTGLHAIRTRHTCGHRVEELLAIIERLRGATPALLGDRASQTSLPHTLNS
jgi:spore maturation protein CgeB